MIKYVVGFMFNDSRSEIALIRKNRPEWQANKWNGIGGKIEPGETAEGAMRREFCEETGVDFDGWIPFVKLTHDNPNNDKAYEVFFFVAYDDIVQECRTCTDELVSVGYTDMVPYALCVDNLKWLLPMAASQCVQKGVWIEIGDVEGD